MTIQEYNSSDIKNILPLLLLGDESVEMIRRYIFTGRIFAGYVGSSIVAVCVTIELADGRIEVKNLAVAPEMQRKGIGRAMLNHVESVFPGKRFCLGTGETPSTLRFYHACGYRYSHRIENFFVDNYPHPIIEDGIRLKDMLYLEKESSYCLPYSQD